MGGDNGDNEVMTLPEVAEYLQLGERTVLNMAKRGTIPAAKVASQWRFLRPLVRDWLLGHMQALPAGPPLGAGVEDRMLLPLTEVLRPALMTFDVAPGPKEAVIRQLSGPLLATGYARDPSRLLSSLLARERMMTTAIGHGIAIPHPREPISGMFPEPAVALGVCRAGTDFQAIDDQLVHVFFLICATRVETHLRLMANVSWLARQDRAVARLREASCPEDVQAVVRDCARPV